MVLGEYFVGAVVMVQCGVWLLHQPSSHLESQILELVRARHTLGWMHRWDPVICKGQGSRA